jgi:hypothetical protein
LVPLSTSLRSTLKYIIIYLILIDILLHFPESWAYRTANRMRYICFRSFLFYYLFYWFLFLRSSFSILQWYFLINFHCNFFYRYVPQNHSHATYKAGYNRQHVWDRPLSSLISRNMLFVLSYLVCCVWLIISITKNRTGMCHLKLISFFFFVDFRFFCHLPSLFFFFFLTFFSYLFILFSLPFSSFKRIFFATFLFSMSLLAVFSLSLFYYISFSLLFLCVVWLDFIFLSFIFLPFLQYTYLVFLILTDLHASLITSLLI